MIQIKHRYTGSVLFECEEPDDVESSLWMRHAVEKATYACVNLAGANLDGANLAGANLARANLAGAYLTGAYLARANLADANLARAYLAGAYLARANLDGAYLTGANLDGAYLAGAYLAGAYLAGAYLARANLADANLARAYLAGAYLAGANLDGAKIGDKTLIGTRPIMQIGPIGSRSDCLLSYLTDAGVMVKAGCFFGTMDEFAAAVEKKHGDNEHGKEYRMAILMIESQAAIWGKQ